MKFLFLCLFVFNSRKLIYATQEGGLNPDQLTILTSSFDSSSTQQNDPSKYQVKEREKVLEYRFNQGVTCVGVTYAGAQLWSRGSPGTQTLNGLYLTKDSPNVVLFFENKSEAYLYDGNSFQLKDEKTLNPVQLDINNRENTPDYTYSTHDGMELYRPLPDKYFNRVTEGGVTVWETQNSTDYARSVKLSAHKEGQQTLTVNVLSGDDKTYTRTEGGQFKEASEAGVGGDEKKNMRGSPEPPKSRRLSARTILILGGVAIAVTILVGSVLYVRSK